MKSNLKVGDAILYKWCYNHGDPQEKVWIETITSIFKDGEYLVCMLYGYKSVNEWIKPENIIAKVEKTKNSKKYDNIDGCWSAHYQKSMIKNF